MDLFLWSISLSFLVHMSSPFLQFVAACSHVDRVGSDSNGQKGRFEIFFSCLVEFVGSHDKPSIKSISSMLFRILIWSPMHDF